MQGRDDPLGDDPGTEPPRGRPAAFGDDAPVEDQPDLVGPANVEVVVHDLLKEDPLGEYATWSAARSSGSKRLL
jgi:hypothetical protein